MPYDKAINEYINNPLGFLNTEAGIPDNPIPSGTARPYLALHNGKFKDIIEYSVSIGAAGDGAIATNMQEALYFIEAIANETIISPSSKTMMFDNKVNSVQGKDVWYSLGFVQAETSYSFRFGHTGWTSAYWSDVYHYPEDNVTIAIAFNGYTEQTDEFNKFRDFFNEITAIAFE